MQQQQIYVINKWKLLCIFIYTFIYSFTQALLSLQLSFMLSLKLSKLSFKLSIYHKRTVGSLLIYTVLNIKHVGEIEFRL
jgi:hypothetical protein